MRIDVRGMTRRNVALAAVAVAPWTWFVLRGRLGTFGDLVSLGLPALALPALVAVALAAMWVRPLVVAGWFLSFALVFFFAIFGPRLPAGNGTPADPVTVVAANMRYDNPTPVAAVDDVLEIDAAVLVVPETTLRVVDAIGPHYEHHAHADSERNPYGTSVFSRYPLRGARTIDVGNGVLRVEVQAPHPFVLVAAHLHRPSISPGASGYISHGEHYRELRELATAIEGEELPVIIAGDLNLSDRVRGYRFLDRRYVDLTRDGWAGSTYTAGIYRYFLLRIDHVFASDGWCSDKVHQFTITGSDHRGLRLDVGPCE